MINYIKKSSQVLTPANSISILHKVQIILFNFVLCYFKKSFSFKLTLCIKQLLIVLYLTHII